MKLGAAARGVRTYPHTICRKISHISNRAESHDLAENETVKEPAGLHISGQKAGILPAMSKYLGRDLRDLLQFLLRPSPATVGTSVVLAVGLAVIFTAGFTAGLMIITVASIWAIGAWLVSPVLQKKKPQPIISQKPKVIEKYRIARRSYLFWRWSVPSLFALLPVAFLVGHLWGKTAPPAPPVSAALILPTMGCEVGVLPIHLPPASTINVIRLSPGVLKGNPKFPTVGVFEHVGSSPIRSRDWPSKNEGRYMTDTERRKVIAADGIPLPYFLKCDMTNNGNVTLEETIATLLVDTTENETTERHRYKVSFDPLLAAHSFQFYLVPVCSEGVLPSLVQWDDDPRQAMVHVLGEEQSRKVSLRIEKRASPFDLFLMSGVSLFVWNDIKNCSGW